MKILIRSKLSKKQTMTHEEKSVCYNYKIPALYSPLFKIPYVLAKDYNI